MQELCYTGYMSDNNSFNLPPNPALGTGYYVFEELMLLHVRGIIFEAITSQWCYDIEVIADKSKTFNIGVFFPTVRDLDRLVNVFSCTKIAESSVRTVEVLFSATEDTSQWESSINEDQTIVSEAESDGDDV